MFLIKCVGLLSCYMYRTGMDVIMVEVQLDIKKKIKKLTII